VAGEATGPYNQNPPDINGRKVYQLKGKSEDLDGVMVFDPQGKAIGFIKLPERCANLAFGGPKRTASI
jgi:gluconolactonase